MSLRNSYYWTTDYPNMRIDVSYSQTARTGTSATYSVSMAVYFTSSGWHGYGLSAKCTINGASQTLRIKEPSNTWSGSGHKGTWTFNITASAGASGGTLPASIQLWGTEGDTTNINSGSKTVSLSTWNTAPTWTGEGNVNGWTSSQIIAENTSTVTVNIPTAKDNEGNTIYYDVYRYINGASNSKIASGTTGRSVTDNLSGFGQGTKVKYLFKCHDGSLWASGDKWTAEHTKNTFTPANVSASGGIGYSTSSITLTVSGAKNTNGNTTFSYRLFSPDGLTVYNETFAPNSSGQVTFSIYSGSGTRPSNPHIDFSQLKSFVAKGTYKGTLVLKVQTNNAYGSSGSKEVSIAVDLRTNPVPAGLGNPTGAVTVAGGSYFVHNLSTVGISWSGASDRLSAGSLSYELQYKYGTGSWNRLTTTTGTSWSGKLPAVTSATTCYFRVIATTTYGYSATSAEKSITMHYYNSPKVSYRSPNRTTSEFTVYIDSATNTSITAVAISSRTFTGLAGTSKAFTGSATLITDTGLTGDSTYNVVVKVTDNSGLSNATTTINVPVTAYIPIMSITNKGIAISTTADPAYKLTIGGLLKVTDAISITEGKINRGSTTFLRNNGTATIISSDGDYLYLRPNGDLNTSGQVTIATGGTLNAPNLQVNGANVYHTGRKPTPADIGAMADGGTYGTIYLTNWVRPKGTTGIYFQDYGGGWHMQDTTWIRAYNGKAVYTTNVMRADGGFQVCGGNSAVKTGSDNSVRIQTPSGWGDLGAKNTSYFHFGTDRPRFYFYQTVEVNGDIQTNALLYARGGVLYLGQGSNSSWVGFYNTAGRRGYIGKGSPDNDYIYLASEVSKFNLSIGHFCPSATGTYYLGSNSPKFQWKGVCCEGGTLGLSDIKAKENIERLDGTIVSYNEVTNELKEYQLAHLKSNTRAIGVDYYEFIRDRFKPSYYNYKLSEQVNSETGDYVISPEDEYKMLKNVGFIAQDYDIKNDKVAQEFIFEGGDGELSYNHMSYVTVGMIALQQATRKIDALEEENKALRDRLALIEEKLGIA